MPEPVWYIETMRAVQDIFDHPAVPPKKVREILQVLVYQIHLVQKFRSTMYSQAMDGIIKLGSKLDIMPEETLGILERLKNEINVLIELLPDEEKS